MYRIGNKKGLPAFHTGMMFVKLFICEVLLSIRSFFGDKKTISLK
jgi:hypothetical protein